MKKRTKKFRPVDITFIDRMVIYVESHNRREARNKIKTVADLNRYKRNGGEVAHVVRSIVRYHLPYSLGD